MYDVLSKLATKDINIFLKKHCIILNKISNPEFLIKIIVLVINKYIEEVPFDKPIQASLTTYIKDFLELFKRPLLHLFSFDHTQKLLNEINDLKFNKESPLPSVNIQLFQNCYIKWMTGKLVLEELNQAHNYFILNNNCVWFWHSDSPKLHLLIAVDAKSIFYLGNTLPIKRNIAREIIEKELVILTSFLRKELLNFCIDYFAKCLASTILNGTNLLKILDLIPNRARSEFITFQENYWENKHNYRCKMSIFSAKLIANERSPMHYFLNNTGSKFLIKNILLAADIYEPENCTLFTCQNKK